jgi:DNA-binding MarR family transcriptional regulator
VNPFTETDAYHITWLVRRMFRSMAQVSDGYLQPLGVSAAERALLEFLHPDRARTVPEIARAYRVSRQHIQTLANALAERDLIEFRENPRHRRSPKLALNSAGRRLFRRIQARDKKAIRTLFKGLPAADCRCTRETLERLLSRLDKAGELR